MDCTHTHTKAFLDKACQLVEDYAGLGKKKFFTYTELRTEEKLCDVNSFVTELVGIVVVMYVL